MLRSRPEMRPTSNKVREALFDILEARVVKDWADEHILDLFSGSGALGFEALSRGAAFVDFVEHHLNTAKEIKKLVKNFEAEASTEVHCRGVLDALTDLGRQGKKYSIVFMDPPYGENWIVPTFNRILEVDILEPKSLLVAEHSKREHLTPLEGFWRLLDARRYGDTMVSLYCLRANEKYWEGRFRNDDLS